MKNFQKIKSLDAQEIYFEKLSTKGVKVITYEKGDELAVTEKIDGANAQVRNIDGVLHCYSHHKELSEDNTLNGFYGFVQDNYNLLLDFIEP